MKPWGETSSEQQKHILYSETEILWAKIVEQGADSASLASWRSQLSQNLQALGVLDNDGKINLEAWMDLVVSIFNERNFPGPPDDYPELEKFTEGLKSLNQKDNNLIGKLKPRSGFPMDIYLYRIGIVMSSQVAYEHIFENDPIVVGSDGSIQNGRHRILARTVIDNIGYDTSSWSWIETEYE